MIHENTLVTQPHTKSLRIGSKPAYIIFRCDDYRTDGGLIERVEHDLVVLFAKYHVPLVLGVIPEKLETRPDKIDFLKPYVAAGIVEIAQHGWEHKPNPELLAKEQIKSEFANRTYEDQFERIAQGKCLLETNFQRPVRTFIPPWDSYDLTTIRVCAELGFSVLSADIYSPVDSAYPSPMLLPSTVKLPSLEMLIERWKKQPQPGAIAVVEFHAYEFVESGSELGYFSLTTLERLLAQMTQGASITALSLNGARQRLGAAIANRRYRMAQRVERSAAKIYQTTWRNRLGNYLGVPLHLEPATYETTQFYVNQEVKQKLLFYSPFIFTLLCLSALIMIVVKLGLINEDWLFNAGAGG